MGRGSDQEARAARALHATGFLAAADEASLLLAASGGDPAQLQAMLDRRLGGEPLAWITGRVAFCGLELQLRPGVYVPRPHTEMLAQRAARRLASTGTAIDICTGSGAVAAWLMQARPGARVLATDIDAGAVACARANGVPAQRGDLFAPLSRHLRGAVDVITGVVPYVPSAELAFLQRDTFSFESPLAYDGGRDGLRLLRRAVRSAARWLRPGGALLLELGGRQAEALRPLLEKQGFERIQLIRDEDGDARAVEATLRRSGRRPQRGVTRHRPRIATGLRSSLGHVRPGPLADHAHGAARPSDHGAVLDHQGTVDGDGRSDLGLPGAHDRA